MITKDEAKAILILLQRLTISVSEIDAYQAIKAKLVAIANAPEIASGQPTVTT